MSSRKQLRAPQPSFVTDGAYRAAGRSSDSGITASPRLPGIPSDIHGEELLHYSGVTVRDLHPLSYSPAEEAGTALHSIIESVSCGEKNVKRQTKICKKTENVFCKRGDCAMIAGDYDKHLRENGGTVS